MKSLKILKRNFFFFLMKESVKQIGIALNLNLFLVQSLEQFIDSKF